MEIFLAFVCVVSLIGAIAYNPLRRKMAGIVGVIGAYMITTGLISLGMLIAQLFRKESVGVNLTEIIVLVAFMIGCLGYMVFVMLTRCPTVGMRILFPFAAFMIAMGFVFRVLLAIFLHIPMENGQSAASASAAALPTTIYDNQGEEWRLQSGESGGYATYSCTKTGQSIGFHTSGEMWLPNGWRAGS